VWCSALSIGLEWIDFTKRVGCAGSSCHRLDGMARELRLRIIIEQPPPGVDFGLQKGSGNAYETVQEQRSDGKDLVFEFQPSIRAGDSDTMVALGGPFVQGSPRQRFVYIDIGTCAGQADSCWSRRLKISLDGIPAKFIGTGGILEARVPGTGRDGGPSCATVKDFEGWKPAMPSKL
jgi:hypothetical protein